MSLFELSQVTKTFGARKVLDIQSLNIEARRIYALLGPNGAGKTTLLHLLAFLDAPTSGVIRYRGEPVGHAEPVLRRYRREVILVEQFPILFTTSVWKNLDFGLKIRGVAKDRRARIIEEALEVVDMLPFAHAAAHRLSGGETQRVALARALALAPRVLLCDEPLSSIDAENQAVLLDLLRQIAARRQMTVVFTTHDRRQASELTEHMLVLDQGCLVPGAYENIFSAAVERGADGQPRLSIRDVLRLRLSAADVPASLPHRVRVFIDPAKIGIGAVADEAPNGGSKFIGRVIQAVRENGAVRLVVDVGVKVIVALDNDAYRRMMPLVGDRVSLELPAGSYRILE